MSDSPKSSKQTISQSSAKKRQSRTPSFVRVLVNNIWSFNAICMLLFVVVMGASGTPAIDKSSPVLSITMAGLAMYSLWTVYAQIALVYSLFAHGTVVEGLIVSKTAEYRRGYRVSYRYRVQSDWYRRECMTGMGRFLRSYNEGDKVTVLHDALDPSRAIIAELYD